MSAMGHNRHHMRWSGMSTFQLEPETLARRQGGGIVVRYCAGEAILAHLATLPTGGRTSRRT